MYFKERTLFDLNILQNIIKNQNNDIKKINVYDWSKVLDINTCGYVYKKGLNKGKICGTRSSVGNKLCCHHDRKNNKRPKQKRKNTKIKLLNLTIK